jgi:hypothetical protein
MAPESSPRTEARYDFEVPMSIELSRGLLRPADRVPAILVDLSKGGAAITTQADDRLRLNKRYRVIIDDRAGIIAVKNLVPAEGDLVRLGVQFKSLGLELQEIVSDALHEAQWMTSRLDQVESSLLQDFTAGR